MSAVTVTWEGGVAFRIRTREIEFLSDQPVAEGGKDSGPSPVELFIASLGSCIGYYVARYCERHDIPMSGLRVDLDWTDAEHPHRIGSIQAMISIPPGLPEAKRAALIRVAEGCTVHHTLTHPPQIAVELRVGGR